jgi:hypothetical protein
LYAVVAFLWLVRTAIERALQARRMPACVEFELVVNDDWDLLQLQFRGQQAAMIGYDARFEIDQDRIVAPQKIAIGSRGGGVP